MTMLNTFQSIPDDTNTVNLSSTTVPNSSCSSTIQSSNLSNDNRRNLGTPTEILMTSKMSIYLIGANNTTPVLSHFQHENTMIVISTSTPNKTSPTTEKDISTKEMHRIFQIDSSIVTISSKLKPTRRFCTNASTENEILDDIDNMVHEMENLYFLDQEDLLNEEYGEVFENYDEMPTFIPSYYADAM